MHSSLFLIRHGQTEGNVNRVILGREDFTLNSLGVQQAQKCAQKLCHIGPVQKIYTSPVKRALQTAQIMAQMLQVDIEIDEDLTEIDPGPWQGQSYEAIRSHEKWDAHIQKPLEVPLPGFETVKDSLVRSSRCLKKKLDQLKEAHIILVSHGDVLRLMLAYLLHTDMNYFRQIYIEHCRLQHIQNTEYGPRLLGINLQQPLDIE